MKGIIALTVISLGTTSSFNVGLRQTFQRSSVVLGAIPEKSGVPIIITGNNIEVTPSLMDYVNRKVERTVGKFAFNGAIIECDVHLSVNKNPKVSEGHKAEVVTSLKGLTIRAAEETADMYASIDKVADRLARKLRQYKERRNKGLHGGKLGMGENVRAYMDNVDEVEESSYIEDTTSKEEEFVDPFEPVVTKIKSFDLEKAISVKEAIFALDYIDHDFYVFRDDETQEISVVYKRNAGGVGLIQSTKDS